MSEDKKREEPAPPGEPEPNGGRFPDLEEMQHEIDKRIRDNQRFLERFMDEDFVEEGEEEDSGEEFEEL